MKELFGALLFVLIVWLCFAVFGPIDVADDGSRCTETITTLGVPVFRQSC